MCLYPTVEVLLMMAASSYSFVLTCPVFTCRESEATANLGAVLTGSTLVTMFVVRKLGLTLAELDDVTSGTTTAAEAKQHVTAFGETDASASAGYNAPGGVETRKEL